MSNNLKIFLGISYLLILFSFLYFIFTSIEIHRLDDFVYYKELQGDLDIFISKNKMINLIYFFIFAVIWVALARFWLTYFNYFGNFIWQMARNINFSNFNFFWSIRFYTQLEIFFLEILLNQFLKKNLKNIFNCLKKMNFTIFLYTGLLEG